MSAEIHDYMDGTRAWLYATPDLNADGMDEIALGVDGQLGPGFASIALYRSTATASQRSRVDCGPACDPVNWIDLGAIGERSASWGRCAANEFGGRVRSRSAGGVKEGPAELNGALWIYDGSVLRMTDVTVHRTGEASVSFPTARRSFCGSTVMAGAVRS